MRRLEVDETMKHSKIIPRHLMILDAAVVLVSVSISFFLRLGFFLMYRPYWGYVSWREISLTALASIVGTITLIAVYLLVSRLPFLSLDGFPRSVFGIDWLITLLGIGSIRWIAYSVLRQKERKISGLHKA
jgi:FlaA1/EpsC-like NDP-sugar epimerase